VVEPVALGAQVCRDPDDDVVLGTAIAGRCDVIVTGDKEIQMVGMVAGLKIMSPRQFWQELTEG
jgi:predicted nucleic acid-binding protein